MSKIAKNVFNNKEDAIGYILENKIDCLEVTNLPLKKRLIIQKHGEKHYWINRVITPFRLQSSDDVKYMVGYNGDLNGEYYYENQISFNYFEIWDYLKYLDNPTANNFLHSFDLGDFCYAALPILVTKKKINKGNGIWLDTANNAIQIYIDDKTYSVSYTVGVDQIKVVYLGTGGNQIENTFETKNLYISDNLLIALIVMTFSINATATQQIKGLCDTIKTIVSITDNDNRLKLINDITYAFTQFYLTGSMDEIVIDKPRKKDISPEDVINLPSFCLYSDNEKCKLFRLSNLK